jgi:hypothetical protein
MMRNDMDGGQDRPWLSTVNSESACSVANISAPPCPFRVCGKGSLGSPCRACWTQNALLQLNQLLPPRKCFTENWQPCRFRTPRTDILERTELAFLVSGWSANKKLALGCHGFRIARQIGEARVTHRCGFDPSIPAGRRNRHVRICNQNRERPRNSGKECLPCHRFRLESSNACRCVFMSF